MKRTDTYMSAGVASLFTAHLLFHDQHMICLPVVLLLISSALFLAAVREGRADGTVLYEGRTGR